MSDTINQILTESALQILHPLVRVMIRNGVSSGSFEELVRKAYVDEAFSIAAKNRQKTTISGVSVQIGLSRKEVKRLNELPSTHNTDVEQKYNRAVRVISGWCNDDNFIDAQGNAKTLRLSDERDSFAALVKQYSGDITPKAMLDLLLNAECIKIEDNMAHLVKQATAVVEKDAFVAGTTIIEAKGTITGLSANNFTLTVGSAKLTVDANATGTSGLADGQFVEVKGTITDVNGTSISATRVKPEDNNPAEGAEVEIEGIITDFDAPTNTFKIDGIVIDASSSALIKTPSTLTVIDGIKVEVEGLVTNGVLQANTLKLREGNVRVHAPAVLDTNTANTLIMTVSGNGVKVTIDTSTELEDKEDFETFTQAVVKLNNQFLRVRGINNGNGILATRIRIEDPDDDVILQGVVGSKDPGNNSITILDITVEVDGSTEFKNIDNTVFQGSRIEFFNNLVEGTTLIKIKDKDLNNSNGISDTDGIADEIELQLP